MTYQVTARKWRPNVFDELVGQNHISQTLLNALNGDRIPHALLFTGPRGTGKTSTARILAKSLRCPNAKKFVPCGACGECEDIASSRSLDVIEIDGASNNGVDAIRELRDTVSFMPSSGKYKVYIIDEVHMLSSSAFNALLKTLEEPPAHVVFIMATTEVQKIPHTVLSRCQRFDFRKISTRQIAEHLTTISQKEKIKIESEAIWAIARHGDGSMRDSQSLLDQVVSFCDGDLTLEKVTEALGLTDRVLLISTIKALIDRDTQGLIGVIEKIFSSGHDPAVYMKDLLEELRHLVLIKMAPQQSQQIVDLPADEIQRLSELVNLLSEEDIHLLFDMALKGAHDMHRAQDPRIVLEMLLLRMSIAPRVRDLASSSAHTQPTAQKNGSSTATKAVNSPSTAPKATTSPLATTPSSPSQSSTPTALATGFDERWNDFVSRVKKVNGLMAAKLEQVQLLNIQNQVCEIGIPEKYKFLFSELSDSSYQKKIVNYLNTFWGPGHSLKVAMVNPEQSQALSPKQLDEKKAEEKKAALTKQVEEHPLVRQAKTIFNTQIKSIREN